MLISVVIPAYKEEEKIINTLKDIINYFSIKKFSYEIIVVNDGSTDKTLEVLRNFKEDNDIKNLRIISYNVNKGKGYAVKTGMLAATGDYRLYMDADNAIKIKNLDDFLLFKDRYEVIIGSVLIKGAKAQDSYKGFSKSYRRILAKPSKLLTRVLTIWEIQDTQRAFKVFSKSAVEKIFTKQTINRWGFDIEILIIAKKHGFKIKEVPVVWINPPSESLNLKSYFSTLKELFIIKYNSLGNKYN